MSAVVGPPLPRYLARQRTSFLNQNKQNFLATCRLKSEFKSLMANFIKSMKNLQFQSCNLCGENAIEHRLEIHCEEDKQRLGIPVVPANENLRFLYRCCVQGCPFHAIRHLKHAAAFHLHMQKHDPVSLFYKNWIRVCSPNLPERGDSGDLSNF